MLSVYLAVLSVLLDYLSCKDMIEKESSPAQFFQTPNITSLVVDSAVVGKLLPKCNIFHITSYLYLKVISFFTILPSV